MKGTTVPLKICIVFDTRQILAAPTLHTQSTLIDIYSGSWGIFVNRREVENTEVLVASSNM